MSDSRLEKFIYAICSMDVSDLPVPLSRIETLWNCLITGETPDFEPLSRNEKYLMAMLDRYDISNLPAPMSRGEKLLYKIAVGETDLSDVPGYLSRYEELLKYLIENGGISGGDFEYVLYTLNQSFYTLYTTAKKPVKSAILKGNTGYRDIDTGEFLETFEEGRNLELVSVKIPVLTTTGKNLFDMSSFADTSNHNNNLTTFPNTWGRAYKLQLKPNTTYVVSRSENVTKLSNNMCVFNGDESNQVSMQSRTQNVITTINDGILFFSLSGTAINKEVSSETIARLLDEVGFIQVEEGGSAATSYEPYKSNILTVNEPVELHGIGEVRDELNLLTGELTQRVGEVVLDGSEEGWILESFLSNDEIVYFNLKDIENIKTHVTTPTVVNALTDKLKVSSYVRESSMKSESYFQAWTNHFIGVSRNKLITQDVNGFKQWLSDNNLRIKHQLSENSVKTVDLTVVNQDNQPTQLGTFDDTTHVLLNSEGLIPTASLTVRTKIPSASSTSLLMDDISTKQEQLETTVDEQSNNVDATMIATTEIFEEIL